MLMEYSSETEKKIVEAATTVFLEKGMDGARMEEIARNAGINKALLHYYFRSKEKLYQEVLRNEVRHFYLRFFNSISPVDEFSEFLKHFIYNYIDQIKENPQVVRFIFWEIGRGGKLVRSVLREILSNQHTRIPHLISDKINKAIAEKKIRPVDPQHLLFSLIGMSIFVFIAKPVIETLFEDIDVNSSSFIEKRKSEIFNLVWFGLKI